MPLFLDENIVNAASYKQRRCKATIQNSGKLGFSNTAAQLLKLSTSSRFLVSDIGNGNYAAVVLPNSLDERGFVVRKASNYFTVDMKAFFDQKGIDYRRKDATIMYDIVPLPETYQGEQVFKMTVRIHAKRNQKAKSREEASEEKC